jgi:hypothetical protein
MTPATSDITKGWPYHAERGISPEDAQKLCVQHAEWQTIRLSMKGEPTYRKLEILRDWREGMKRSKIGDGWVQVDEQRLDVRLKQIDNYLGALRRGGQLDDNNMIRKYI